MHGIIRELAAWGTQFFIKQDDGESTNWVEIVPAAGGPVPSSRQVIAGGVLTGGGTLAADVTISLAEATIDHNNITNVGSNDHAAIDAFIADASHTIRDDTAGEIAAITAKATPIGGDRILIEDSADSDSKKSVLLSSLSAIGYGHTIREDSGDMASQIGLHFSDAYFSLSDDGGNNETDVNLNLGMAPVWTGTHTFNAPTAITHSATGNSFKFTSNTVLGNPVASKAFEFKSANVSQAQYHTLWTDTNDAALLRLEYDGVLTFAGDADDEYIHEKRATRTTASWTPQSGTWDFSLATVVGVGGAGVHVGASAPSAGRERLWIDTDHDGGGLFGALKIDFLGTGIWLTIHENQ